MKDPIKLIEVKEDILADNTAAASALRNRLSKHKTFLVNLMSSPGAGKTSLLIRTISALSKEFSIAVIEADIDSTVDAETIRNKTGVKSVQLQTGGFCHLDASMVEKGIKGLGDNHFDLIFIENVGNLVCPAEFDTGAHLDAMILSVPEGDDKPLKYPLMFTKAGVLVVNKTDLVLHTDFDMKKMASRVKKLNPAIEIIPVSCKTGEGIEQWTLWLKNKILKRRTSS